MINAPSVPIAGRAAMYVRMSTEHQQYSIENQAAAVENYAVRHGFLIVKRFLDYGRSGLRLSGRMALRRLLQEVESGAAEFDSILVYDVSRWGRFQDIDESAYYEFICKRARIQVHYCAEPFDNDGSPYSMLLKTLKRSMAAEYSRELSVKVFAGQARLVQLGYRQGGTPGFGLRRRLVDRDGNLKGILKFGERKAIQSDRVILVPGPKRELIVVREIFDLFTVRRKSEREIRDILNERGEKSGSGQPWTRCTVHQVLTNPKYMGSNVFNRRSFKLNQRVVRNPADTWIRRDGAFTAIIPPAKYIEAEKLIQLKAEHLTDEQMLESLKGLLKRAGSLTANLINKDRSTPCVAAFQKRFTSLTRCYNLIGYKPSRNYKGIGRASNKSRTVPTHSA
jgi:DNA invertase Pin-like site-specific DNA recombinase